MGDLCGKDSGAAKPAIELEKKFRSLVLGQVGDNGLVEDLHVGTVEDGEYRQASRIAQ